MKTRAGMADVVLVALIALVSLGGTLLYRARASGRPQVERRYRSVVRATMTDVSEALGLDWKDEGIRVVVVPGERRASDGYWERWIESEQDWKAGYAYLNGHCIVVVDPNTRELPGGRWSVLGHEVTHLLMDQHGIPRGEHHARMRRAGVLWERR